MYMTAIVYTKFSIVKLGQWVDIDTLIKELQQIEGIQSISKGRFFLSPGLAPTFQVWTMTYSRFSEHLLSKSITCFQIYLFHVGLYGIHVWESVQVACSSRKQSTRGKMFQWPSNKTKSLIHICNIPKLRNSCLH